MTTDRTSIRRRLSIGSRAHRPPWSTRKFGHGTILAPLAVTVAASAAIGLGVALARVGEEIRTRRNTARTPRTRRLGLHGAERLGPGLQRMAVEQADIVLEQLEAAGENDLRRPVHESRKAIKRLRTIIRLLESELGSRAAKREHDALRAAATLLAGARDAEVLLETLEELVSRRGSQLARRPGIVSLRLALASERERAEQKLLAPGSRLQVTGEMRAFRARAEAWQLRPSPGLAVVEDGLGRIYGQGRRRLKRARRKSGGHMRAMHSWRKRVKDLRYAAEAIQRRDGGSSHEDDRLRSLGRSADRLSEVLGQEHDLAVLDEWLSLHGATAGAGRGTRRRLRGEIEKRRRRLRRRALREGAVLYERSRKDFLRRTRKAYKRGRPKLSRR